MYFNSFIPEYFVDFSDWNFDTMTSLQINKYIISVNLILNYKLISNYGVNY